MAALNRTRFSSVWMLVRTLYLLFQVQELLDRPPLTGSCNVLHCCGGAGDLDQVAVEEACDGNFVDLKKGLFVLRRSEAPLLAKVQSRFCMCPSGTSWCPWTSSRPGHQLVPGQWLFFWTLQAQALLRWHQTSGFCAATGQATHRNQAGSQRVSSSGSVYYPQVDLLAGTPEGPAPGQA